MFDDLKIVDKRELAGEFIKTLPWVAFTGTSLWLYFMEHKRVTQLLKENAEREQKTNEFNAWLQSENFKLEQQLGREEKEP